MNHVDRALLSFFQVGCKHSLKEINSKISCAPVRYIRASRGGRIYVDKKTLVEFHEQAESWRDRVRIVLRMCTLLSLLLASAFPRGGLSRHHQLR